LAISSLRPLNHSILRLRLGGKAGEEEEGEEEGEEEEEDDDAAE